MLSMIRVQDFEIDEFSQEYRALHPMPSTKQPSLVEEHFRPAMEDNDPDLSDSDASATSLDEPGHENSRLRMKGRTPR